MKKQFLMACLCLFLGSNIWANTPQPSKITNDMRQLVGWWLGDFTNKKQALKDAKITELSMSVVEIWRGIDKGTVWLYEEISDSKYIVSQRFYHMTGSGDNQIQIDVFTVEDSKIESGELQKKKPFDTITPDDLDLQEPCMMMIVRKGDTKFAGKTFGNECTLGRTQNGTKVSTDLGIYELKIMRTETQYDYNNNPLPTVPIEFRRKAKEDPKKAKK